MSARRLPERVPVAAGWGAVALLTSAYVLSYVDRTMIALLVGPIRADLHIGDTQFSLLNGLAFALLYTLVGIAVGRLADRGHRSRIAAGGVALWSVMTAACGLATGFGTLFVARVGVGVGEASLSPAAYSLIADLFPGPSMARALAVYGSGVYLGIGATFLGGGWLVEHITALGRLRLPILGTLAPWQTCFLVVALPGLLLAPVIALLIREPREAATSEHAETSALMPFLRCRRGFLIAHFAGFSLLTLAFNGYLAWIAEYFLRAHGWSKAHTGLWLGAIVMSAGIGGMLGGGLLTERLLNRGDTRAPMTVALVGAVSLLPWCLFATTSDSPQLSLLGVAPILGLTALCFGPAIVALQRVTPAELRGQVSALYLFVVNLTGIGLGSTAVAAMSDGLSRDGTQLGPAMALIGGMAFAAAVPTLWLARRRMVDADG